MKRILYFDAAAGVSGDMFVGALLDLGASLDRVRGHVAALGVEGIELGARNVISRGIAATKFDVLDPASGRPVDEPPARHAHGEGGLDRSHPDHGHGHGHAHGHGDHDHRDHHPRGHGGTAHGHRTHPGHAHDHGADHAHGDHSEHGHAHVNRGLREIRRLVRGSGLPAPVAEDALAVFELLATAEAKVHGVSPEQIHFHEVGALDSIADVVAAASAFHEIAPDEAWCSPVHVGSGTVRCAHGLLPVPAPATSELLKGIPAYSDGTRGELATPTGVALLRHFCNGFSAMPPLVIEAVGYGAGSKDFGIPGVLRATLGTVGVRPEARRAAGSR
jgi:pyridinium-3,5-bisthiocarboxylic acid mononucleotide nickel chelatase